MEDATGRELYQEHELLAYLGDYADDFDLDAIRDEATEIDYRTGKTYWREGVDLNEIARKHEKGGE